MLKAGLLKLIRVYQRYLSPSLPKACRFYPSCSEYAREAVEKHGAGKGLCQAFFRILKCHPFRPGGFDPVK